MSYALPMAPPARSAKTASAGAGNDFEEFVHYGVAEHQEAVVGPDRPFGKVEILATTRWTSKWPKSWAKTRAANNRAKKTLT